MFLAGVQNRASLPWKRKNKSILIHQIPPGRIVLFNKPQLPPAIPLLELFFSSNGIQNVVMKLVPNQQMDLVPFGEPIVDIVFVLMDAAFNVVRHAHVQCAITLAGEDVNEVGSRP
jgi:hypothetical protein